MTPFKFGALSIDPVVYGSQGSAVLGIRDSGKTYTATLLAEQLHGAGIPFLAIDPIGVWRFLRVPADRRGGRGFPVVVAGGQEPDLQLTPENTEDIVRAAMVEGVSIVLDLFSMDLSKADWGRIVKSAVRTLLHNNHQFGLRHVFIEEAAEFVPQMVRDGHVYAEVEKLARMGGNARLGYTLINQRAEEVNKAVLELCDNLFLHRQKGRNSLTALDKWLNVGEVDNRQEIIGSLATLPTGECWAWMAGSKRPVRVKVPAKASLHPDRRVMRHEDGVTIAPAVDVGAFLERMRASLGAATAPIKEKPVKAAAVPRLPPFRYTEADLQAADQRGYERGLVEGERREWARAQVIAQERTGERILEVLAGLKADAEAAAALPPAARQADPAPAGPTVAAEMLQPPTADKPYYHSKSPPGGDDALTNPQLTLLKAMAWWAAMGHHEPRRPQIAAIAGWKPTGSNLRDRLSECRRRGLVVDAGDGRAKLTSDGHAAAPAPDLARTVVDGVREVLTGPQLKLFDVLVREGKPLKRPVLAANLGWAPDGSNLRDRLSELRRLEVVNAPKTGPVSLADWIMEARP